jgi:polysaccharide biosynthesis transport protein
MELKHYINIIWRRKWIVILTVIVTMGMVILGTHLQTPIYQASTTLRIATSAGSQLSYQDYMYADRLMNTYSEISTSGPVMAELVKRLNLSKPPTITTELLPNTELIRITVQDPDSKLAATAANTLADILITQTYQLYTGGGITSTEALGKQLAFAKDELEQAEQDYQQLLIQTPAAPEVITASQRELDLRQNTYSTLLSQYGQASIREAVQENMVTIVEPAQVPQSPSKPRRILNYALGMAVGLLGGLGLMFLFENLDTTLYTFEEIEHITKLNSIGGIPKGQKNQLDISKNRTSPYSEAFRNLATKIQLITNQPNQVLLVMGAEPRQGKSMIVTNLAYALAESGKKVIALDCDLRLPKLNKLFHLANQDGLSDILQRKTSLRKSLQKSQNKGVYFLSSGSPDDHPSILLNTSRMENLIESLKLKFDFILLDTPALLSFTDTEILMRYANSLIVVARQGYTKRESIISMSKFLGGFQEKAICLVINQVKDKKDYGYYANPPKSKRFPNVNHHASEKGENTQVSVFTKVVHQKKI